MKNETTLSLFMVLLYSTICHADVVDDLIPIIIQAESGGRANIIHPDGAIGLMGISYSALSDYCRVHGTGRQYPNGADDLRERLFDPKFNVEVGTWYLRWIRKQLPKRYEDDPKRIISAYNNGIGWLRKHNWQPPNHHKNETYNAIYEGKLS